MADPADKIPTEHQDEADADETVESINPPDDLLDGPEPEAEADTAKTEATVTPDIPPPPPATSAETTSSSVDPQYHLLFELLAVYSTRLRDKFKQACIETGKPYHPRTALFEITAHMIYLLSISMLDRRQEMTVLKSVMIHCQAMSCHMKDFEGLALQDKHLNDIIVARVEQYTQAAHRAATPGKLNQEWVRFLRKNLDASRTASGVAVKPEFIKNDADEKKIFRAQLLWIHEQVAGEFQECLRLIFEEVQDIRNMSTDRMQELIGQGQKLHRANILAKAQAAQQAAAAKAEAPQTAQASAEGGKKKWWKPWSSQAS